MEKFLKKAGWTSVITSLVFGIIGLIMIFYPTTTMQFISTVLGIFFIVVGIVKVINYFVSKGNSTLFTNDIAWGLIAVILGLVTIVYSSTIENIYADTSLTKKIGYLNPRETCDCFGIFNGRPMVRYKVDGSNNYKIGFAKWTGGVK